MAQPAAHGRAGCQVKQDRARGQRRGNGHLAFAPAIQYAPQPRQREPAGDRAQAISQTQLHARKSQFLHQHIGEYREAHGLARDAEDGAERGGKDNHPAVKKWALAWGKRRAHPPETIITRHVQSLDGVPSIAKNNPVTIS